METHRGVETLIQDTLWREAARPPEQGRVHRMLDHINLTAQDIGRKGTTRRLLSHRANAFSREIYKNKDIKKLHLKFGHVPEVEGKDAQLEVLLQCPWCKPPGTGTQAKADLRQLHLYCTNDHITSMRNLMNNYLEDLALEFHNYATALRDDSSHM